MSPEPSRASRPRATRPRATQRRPVPARGKGKLRPAQGWKLRATAAILAAIVTLLAWAAMARHAAPQGTASSGPVDALLVLGTPADADGNPTPAMQDRVNEAVAEYQRGAATRIVFSGGAAHNHFVEANVMARAAIAQGVPQSAIYRDPAALDTIQNLCNSLALARANGWRSVEVISSPAHLPRVRLILAASSIRWRVHAAPEVETQSYIRTLAPAVELLKTARYLAWSSWHEFCPALTQPALTQ